MRDLIRNKHNNIVKLNIEIVAWCAECVANDVKSK